MPKVTFHNNGEEEDVAQGASLPDVTKEAGWPIAYGCEDGLCGTCVIRVTKGKDDGLEPPTEVEKQTLDIMGLECGEYRLACQCKVKGDLEIEQ